MITETLTKRRNEISAEIKKLKASLIHLDATIKLFAENEPVKRPRHEGLTRAILDLLREADKPLTTGEIAGTIEADPKRVGITLNTQQKKGLVTGKRDGAYAYWKITR